MDIKRFLKQFVTDPNSSDGLLMRAEEMREHGDKEQEPEQQEKNYLYAEVLIELARKKWSPRENKAWITEHLHTHLRERKRTG